SSYFDTACKPTPERGICKGFLDRWFFNVSSGACETFLYSGCGGNLNEYQSQWECEFACMGKSDFSNLHQIAQIDSSCITVSSNILICIH
ncbi:serine protease inhibitor, putative, partial [Ixodes scapularis]